MNPGHLLAALGLSLALPAMLPVARAAAAPARPNIVILFADDMGYGDLACQNPASKIPTPNLDRLATQSIRFTDAHTTSAVCTPSRYGLLTGRYCWRTALKDGVLGGFSPPLIEAGRETLGTLLKRAGYDTAALGKWHLGLTIPTTDGQPLNHLDGYGGKPTNLDWDNAITGGPVDHGFDHFFGIAASLDMPPYIYIENRHFVGRGTVMKTWLREGPAAPDFEAVDVVPELARRAVGIIERQPAGRPLFLYLALTSPHTPVVPAGDFKGRSRAGDYGDFVVETDDAVGQILAALEKKGLAGATLVIFTSDNGPEVHAYERITEFHHASMGELRGVKRDTWEGGHRVPFLARWPGQIPAGAVSRQTISLVDLLATFASITGAAPAAGAGEDSLDVSAALRHPDLAQPVRPSVVYHGANGWFALRRGDWVLIDGHTGENNRNREPEWFRQDRHAQAPAVAGELFNLRDDPQQTTNLYATHPDIVAQLRQELDAIKAGRPAAVPAN